MTTTPRTWVVGEVVTAAELNAEIRDQFNSFFGAWSTYTPTWNATSAPALGNGTLIGRYINLGRTYHCVVHLTAGSTSTYGSGGYSFSLPATAAASGTGSRVGEAQALAATRVGGQTVISVNGTNVTPFFATSASVTTLIQATPSVPFTWASGNECRMGFTYESA